MATFRIILATQFPKTSKGVQTTDKHSAMAHLLNMLAGINSGGGIGVPATVVTEIDDNKVAATGTVTCVTVANNSTVQVGGVTFTGKTSSPSGSSQFLCGVSATADAAALAAVINAHLTTNQYVSAAPALGVVTITAVGAALGLLGNALILSSSDGTNLAVVAMTGGINDLGKATYAF